MKVLLIEDNKNKIELLSSMLEEHEVIVKEALNETLQFLRKETCKLDLILLDWNFPIYVGEGVKRGAGKRILLELKRNTPYIPVIMTSSEEIHEDLSSFSNVVEHFYPTEDIEKWKLCLSKVQEYQEKHQVFIFTFGEINPLFLQKHTRIVASSYGEARQNMFDVVGDKWCFQYPLENWLEWINSEGAKRFPKEEYISFDKIKEIVKEAN